MASRPMLALPIIHKLGPNLYLWTTHPYQPQTRALRVAWSFVFLHIYRSCCNSARSRSPRRWRCLLRFEYTLSFLFWRGAALVDTSRRETVECSIGIISLSVRVFIVYKPSIFIGVFLSRRQACARRRGLWFSERGGRSRRTGRLFGDSFAGVDPVRIHVDSGAEVCKWSVYARDMIESIAHTICARLEVLST